ncbi:stalk domain-containing protein [Paenibacillus koleovorans]|uniref:stalk domain-containing protein n=1 Tax=Paenibacillus koleovorans TaxID=121608 RepID=UPI000FD6D7A3|nr:stalk domain-containing protein [Paenibacillus koleovorans]
MKGKRLLVLTCAFLVLGAGIAYASSPWGDFQGFTKVKVLINNEEAITGEVPAFVISGRAVLPMRSLTTSMQGLLKWDDATKTASIYKPNVHMFVARDVNKDYQIKQPFGKVKQGDKIDFVVFPQVDNLDTPIYAFKIEIVRPDGNVLRSSDPAVLNEPMESFWYPWPFSGVTFDAYGDYKVHFLMKLSPEDDWTVVSEKVIKSE